MENKIENEEFDLVKEYNTLREKYGLPDYKSLSEDFDIEKLMEKESNFILREVRQAINEKLTGYLHLFESLINPSSPPMFVFSFLRGLNQEGKDKIKKIYKKLSSYQIEIMKLDTIYGEGKEAAFINKAFSEWQELKLEIFNLIGDLEEGFKGDNNSVERGYFG